MEKSIGSAARFSTRPGSCCAGSFLLVSQLIHLPGDFSAVWTGGRLIRSSGMSDEFVSYAGAVLILFEGGRAVTASSTTWDGTARPDYRTW